MRISNIYEDGRRTINLLGRDFWWPFPVAYMLHSSAAKVLGYPVYGGDDTPKFIQPLYRAFCKVSNANYWLKYRVHPQHQYHIVRTGLEPGYYDQNTRMLHACMALLGEYIKEEGGVEKLAKWSMELRTKPDPNGPEGVQDLQADRYDEALAIWYWWTVTRPADQKRCDEMLHELFGKKDRVSFVPTEDSKLHEIVFKPWEGTEERYHDEFRVLEKKINDDEQAYLHRLITIRQSLWT